MAPIAALGNSTMAMRHLRLPAARGLRSLPRTPKIIARSRTVALRTSASLGNSNKGKDDDKKPTSALSSDSMASLDEPEFDFFRDSLLRYMGYTNECGEAFAAWMPAGGVPLSYAVAISYVLMDTVHKGNKAWKSLECTEDAEYCVDDGIRAVHSARSVVDTLVWQLLASVFIPGATIHFGVAAIYTLLHSVAGPSLASMGHEEWGLLLSGDTMVAKSIPTFFGLGIIPFIVHPIDNAVHKAMDMTSRPAMHDALCGHFGGEDADLDECTVEDVQFPMDTRPAAPVQAAVVLASLAYSPAVFSLSHQLFGR